MNKLCRQVSIESPSQQMKDCVFNFVVPVPDTPSYGARILVVYAGACYRKNRTSSISSISSVSSISADLNEILMQQQQQQQLPSQNICTAPSSSPAHSGLRDGALFPGFEVAGVIESLGDAIDSNNCNGLHVGQRVIIYPYEGVPHGYSELIVVPDLKYLVPIPDNLPLSIAAMLPTGALLAKSAILSAHNIVDATFANRGENSVCKILIVGTGGLALWAVRMAAQHFYHSNCQEQIQITVASLRDEGLLLAKEFDKYVLDQRIFLIL